MPPLEAATPWPGNRTRSRAASLATPKIATPKIVGLEALHVPHDNDKPKKFGLTKE